MRKGWHLSPFIDSIKTIWSSLFVLIHRRLSWAKPNYGRAPVSDTGNWGENQATSFLQRKGYQIIGRNIRPNRHGEIDIIAKKNHQYIFVEVKTRRTEQYGRPIDAVTPRKRIQLRKAASVWLWQNDLREVHYRFDVIEVIGTPHTGLNDLRHIQEIDMTMTRAPYERIP